MGNHGVVDFQQKSHVVPFVCQLLLGRLGALVVQHVVHGDRHLVRHLLHEVELCFLIGSPLQAPESHRAQTSQRRGKRNRTEGLHAILTQQWYQLGEAAFLHDVVNHQGLLGFPHNSPWGFINRQFQPWANSTGYRHRQDVQAHDLARGIMQDQIDVIERNDARKSLGEIMKQLAQVAV